MPKPKIDNTANPICQHIIEVEIDGQIVKTICGHLTTYNGTQASGAKQYRCRRHKPNWTYTDSDFGYACRKGGKSGTAMTVAERNKEYYLKNKEKVIERVKKRIAKLKAKSKT